MAFRLPEGALFLVTAGGVDHIAAAEFRPSCWEAVEALARGGETTAKAVMDNLRSRYPTTDAAKQALDELVEIDLGEWFSRPPGPQGGRPTLGFRLSARETAKPQGPCEKGPEMQEDGRFRGFAGARPEENGQHDEEGPEDSPWA